MVRLANSEKIHELEEFIIDISTLLFQLNNGNSFFGFCK
jgi:hypothetical protein